MAEAKSILDTDTPLDYKIHRPLARFLARAISRTSVTPNQVTLFSLFLAFGAAGGYLCGNPPGAVIGLFFFYVWAVLDHTDGELARTTHRTSIFGERLDDTCDSVASTAILGGIFLGALRLAPPDGRLSFTLLFLPALSLNAYYGAVLMQVKRLARIRYKRSKSNRPEFVRFQRILDHFTGREPFYLLLFFTLFTFHAGVPWVYVLINILIGGSYLFGIGYFLVVRHLRRQEEYGFRPAPVI